ncbi:hypothetical protein GXM_08011 [Nostoc sphaeroides CCNUC1]|uniref:Uncharacterized protein n=1 Tax=Nostoc sphaeroides CCNUC1 TaxID=2653204 RepID=A0A5P8WCH6_9NOSO|nr:hypothetical protein GXM_08011 [Nostoc sphaeroides CCNUC1]
MLKNTSTLWNFTLHSDINASKLPCSGYCLEVFHDFLAQ